VVGVEDQRHVHDPRHFRVRILAVQHVEQIAGMAQVVARRHRFVPMAHAVERGHDRRQLGDEPHHRGVAHFLVAHVLRWVKHAERRHRRLQRIHRMPVLGQALQEIDDAKLEPAMMGEVLDVLVELGAGGKLSEEEQVRRLFERRVLRQVLDGNPPVLEDSALPVDEANPRFGGRHAREARDERRSGGGLRCHGSWFTWASCSTRSSIVRGFGNRRGRGRAQAAPPMLPWPNEPVNPALFRPAENHTGGRSPCDLPGSPPPTEE
jgi:hypothetical protein